MFDVATIGSVTLDTFLEGDFKTVASEKSPSGQAYFLPLGEKLEVKRIYVTVGGNSANASVTFARQGFKTACVAKIGADIAGEEIERKLTRENVKTFFTRDKKFLTARSSLLLKKGERTILSYHGASDLFRLEDIPFSKIKARWWYVSLAGESDKIFKKLVNFASKNGIAFAFNPSGHHIRHKREEILTTLPKLSFLVLNEEEAALLTGVSFKNEKEVFRKLDRIMPGVLAVTSGRKGATISDGKFIYKAGIFPEKRLVDRTGAGDAFGSGFVAGLLSRGISLKNISAVKPEDIIYAIRLATANSTSVVEKIGATEGILTKSEFQRSFRFKELKIAVKKTL